MARRRAALACRTHHTAANAASTKPAAVLKMHGLSVPATHAEVPTLPHQEAGMMKDVVSHPGWIAIVIWGRLEPTCDHQTARYNAARASWREEGWLTGLLARH